MLAPHLPKIAHHKTALAVAVAVTALCGAGTALAFIGDGTDVEPQPRRPTSGDHAVSSPRGVTVEDQVARTADADAFAISVAQVLFAWDTTASVPLNEYAGRLLAVADPSGEESAGLATDLTTYIPSAESWEDLKTYETRQWIDINSYEVPAGWKSAMNDSDSSDIARGTTAYTITGLRRRTGIWQGETAKTVDEVSFTIFMTCRPTYETCRLLRLSQLNNPLQ